MRSIHTIVLALILTSLGVQSASADAITLLNGRTIEGKITFDAKDKILILPKNLPSEAVGLADILGLTIDPGKKITPKRLVKLVNGAVIGAEDVLAVTESEVRIKRADGSLLSFSPLLVQSIDYNPQEELKALQEGFVGVVTTTGDIAEGEVLGVDAKNVRISSVLFGIQEFEVGKSVRAIQFRPAGLSRAMYVVRTNDGSVWQAASIRIDRGKLILEADVLEKIELSGESVVSVALGAASAETLEPDASMVLTPGTSKEFQLDGKYRAVLLNLGVPGQYVPNRSVRFMVSADGKELSRSSPLTAIDAPLSLTFTVQGAKSFRVRVEADGPSHLGVAGQIIQVRLVRGQ